MGTGFFKGRGERTRAPPGGAPLPRRAEASLLNGLPLGPPNQGRSASKRKEGSSEGSPRRDPGAWRRRTHPQPRFWNFNQIPFRGTPSFGKKRRAWSPFGPPLGATHSRPIAVHAKPFSTSVHKGSTCVVATSTKICTRGGSTPPHGEASTLVTPTPSYSRPSPSIGRGDV